MVSSRTSGLNFSLRSPSRGLPDRAGDGVALAQVVACGPSTARRRRRWSRAGSRWCARTRSCRGCRRCRPTGTRTSSSVTSRSASLRRTPLPVRRAGRPDRPGRRLPGCPGRPGRPGRRCAHGRGRADGGGGCRPPRSRFWSSPGPVALVALVALPAAAWPPWLPSWSRPSWLPWSPCWRSWSRSPWSCALLVAAARSLLPSGCPGRRPAAWRVPARSSAAVLAWPCVALAAVLAALVRVLLSGGPLVAALRRTAGPIGPPRGAVALVTGRARCALVRLRPGSRRSPWLAARLAPAGRPPGSRRAAGLATGLATRLGGPDGLDELGLLHAAGTLDAQAAGDLLELRQQLAGQAHRRSRAPAAGASAAGAEEGVDSTVSDT